MEEKDVNNNEEENINSDDNSKEEVIKNDNTSNEENTEVNETTSEKTEKENESNETLKSSDEVKEKNEDKKEEGVTEEKTKISEKFSFITKNSSLKKILIIVLDVGERTTFIPPKLSATMLYSPSASSAKLWIPINTAERDIKVFIVTDLPAPDLANITML